MLNEVLLVGMPNSGKSTVYNALTKGDAKVGNFHGVTVKALSKSAKIGGNTFTVTDTPGIYSLFPQSLEERVTLNHIKNFNGIIVFLCECATLKRCYDILNGLCKLQKNIILAVNMLGELKGRGRLYQDRLIKSCSFPVIVGDFIKKQDINRLKTEIVNYKIVKPQINAKDFLSSLEISEYKLCKLDRFLNSNFAVIIVALTVFLTMYLAFGRFGIGTILGELLARGVSLITNAVTPFTKNLNPFVSGLIESGVLDGVLGVVSFIPQMLTLIFFLTLLERVGIMARLSYITERFFHKTGLNGRAIFSIIMGFGCTAMGISLSGGLENERVKKKAVYTLGGVSCSAKIPVFILLSKSVEIPFLYMVGVYLIILLFSLFNLYLADNLFVKQKRSPLVMELPPYRLPPLKETLKSLLKLAKQSIIKIGTIIFLISVAVYLLKSLTPRLQYTPDISKSILCAFSKLIAPIFKVVGIGDWRLVASLVAGVFAKEGVASVILALYGEVPTLDIVTLLALTAFIVAYPPCVTALVQTAIECGKKTLVISIVSLYLQAFLLSLLIKLLFNYPIFSVVALAMLALVKDIYEIVHRRKARKVIKSTAPFI